MSRKRNQDVGGGGNPLLLGRFRRRVGEAADDGPGCAAPGGRARPAHAGSARETAGSRPWPARSLLGGRQRPHVPRQQRNHLLRLGMRALALALESVLSSIARGEWPVWHRTTPRRRGRYKGEPGGEWPPVRWDGMLPSCRERDERGCPLREQAQCQNRGPCQVPTERIVARQSGIRTVF
jgi:hypothetical protein